MKIRTTTDDVIADPPEPAAVFLKIGIPKTRAIDLARQIVVALGPEEGKRSACHLAYEAAKQPVPGAKSVRDRDRWIGGAINAKDWFRRRPGPTREEAAAKAERDRTDAEARARAVVERNEKARLAAEQLARDRDRERRANAAMVELGVLPGRIVTIAGAERTRAESAQFRVVELNSEQVLFGHAVNALKPILRRVKFRLASIALEVIGAHPDVEEAIATVITIVQADISPTAYSSCWRTPK